MRAGLLATCEECGRVFDLLAETDAAEYAYGHDCETDARTTQTLSRVIGRRPTTEEERSWERMDTDQRRALARLYAHIGDETGSASGLVATIGMVVAFLVAWVVGVASAYVPEIVRVVVGQ